MNLLKNYQSAELELDNKILEILASKYNKVYLKGFHYNCNQSNFGLVVDFSYRDEDEKIVSNTVELFEKDFEC